MTDQETILIEALAALVRVTEDIEGELPRFGRQKWEAVNAITTAKRVIFNTYNPRIKS